MKTIFTDEYRKLLAWLRESRNEKGLTMRAVGLAMKIPHSWIGKVEIGERRLDVVEYVKFCLALGIDPHEGIDSLISQLRPPRPMAAKKKSGTVTRKRKA